MKVQYLLANGDFQVHKAGCRDIDRLLKKSDYEQPIDAEYATEYEAIHDLYDDQIRERPEPEAEKLTVRFLHDHGYAGSVNFAPCLSLTPLPGPNGLPEKEPDMATNGTRTRKPNTRTRRSTVKPSPSEVRADEKRADAAKPISVGRRSSRTKAENASVFEAPARPARAARTTNRSPKPGVTKTVPARRSRTAPAPEHDPEPQPASGVQFKRAAKRELAQLAVIALDDLVKNLEPESPVFAGMTEDEAARTVSQWIHHFPTGGDWPAELLPKPERSNWS